MMASATTAALIYEARTGSPETWPSGWPAAPQPRSIQGIELSERADAVVILDVLHYIDYCSPAHRR